MVISYHSEQNLVPDKWGAPTETALTCPGTGPGEFSFVLVCFSFASIPASPHGMVETL